ncbi:MAG: ABC transporter ATP-binding protein [Bacteroidales bacterium]|nr:ABC transporter ATP-binding protein [Bacteroidales bacterium]MBR6131820.1 ABC transporter ATP-binding protein [Bacteroidales bacterium]
MIEIRNVEKSYGTLRVLQGINLTIENSKVVTIVGPSGAGKSTLLHLIGTLDRPDSGEIVIDGTHLGKLGDDQLSEFRNRHIGFVYQFHHLLPEFTAAENVALPAMIAGKGRREALQHAMELLDFLKLKERAEHKPSQLSGGEQQRVAVARALMNNPELILADEPSGNLDTDNAKKLHQLFFDLRDQFHQTFVIVTHNEELASLSDRKIQLQDGRVLNT